MNIEDPEHIDQAQRSLAHLDPALALVHQAIPPLRWRVWPKGFSGLLKIVMGQQISVAAANAIWTRLEQGLGEVTPETVMASGDSAFRLYGLSSAKVGHVRGLAAATLSGALDFDGLGQLGDQEALTALVSQKGVGRWSGEIYLMFCEARVDLFPAGDVALKEAVRLADAAPQRLTDRDLDQRVAHWRPFRGVAAHMLWAYYNGVKRGEIIAPTAISSA